MQVISMSIGHRRPTAKVRYEVLLESTLVFRESQIHREEDHASTLFIPHEAPRLNCCHDWLRERALQYPGKLLWIQ